MAYMAKEIKEFPATVNIGTLVIHSYHTKDRGYTSTLAVNAIQIFQSSTLPDMKHTMREVAAKIFELYK